MEKLVFIGGGHAHLESITHIDKFLDLGVQVTVISPSQYLYYSGMGSGLLGKIFEPNETRFNIKKITENKGGSFIEDKAVGIDPDKQKIILESEAEIFYDIASFDVGSYIPTEEIHIKNSTVIPVKPINNLLEARYNIEDMETTKNISFIIVGGGPSGTELVGNIQRLCSNLNLSYDITLITDRELLSEHPRKVRDLALRSLKGREIKVVEGKKVQSIDNNIIYLENNETFNADMIFLANGTRPNKIFMDSPIPTTSNSGMLVNEYLQSIKYPNIFGGGDCIELRGQSLDKVGVYAVRENPIILHNIKAYIQGKKLKKFKPQKKYLLILNMGNGKGIFWRGKFTFKGKLALWIKNFIDKRFMNKYQI